MTISEETDSKDPELSVGERRHVTLLFTDVCNSTPLANAMDPEELQFVMRKIKDLTIQVIRDHEGLVNQDYGDGVMAMFGYPTAKEDDVLRATDAAINLHKAIKRLEPELLLPPDFELHLHSGIHCGLVFIVAGDRSQGHYELTGDTVNLTARLCSQSAPDEITVSAETLRGQSGFFETETLEALHLRGVEEPIAALRVLGRSGAHTRFEERIQRGLTKFVGRTDEMGMLNDGLQQARRGNLCIVAIVGDAGVGKTRVAEEFLNRIRNVEIQRGFCEGYGNVAPLQPFMHMLRRLLDLAQVSHATQIEDTLIEGLDVLLLEQVRAVMNLLSQFESSTPEQRAQQDIVNVLTDLFVAIASQRPLLLFIDDWQWADDASRQVVRSLAKAAASEPVFLVVTTRALDPKDWVGTEYQPLNLQPFTREESEQTVRLLLPDWVDLGVASRIHEQSGGNVLFIEELCEAEINWAPDEVTVQNSSRVKGVPGWLYSLIETRVAHLPDVEAELVRSAAVIGVEVPLWLLQQISGYSNLSKVLEGNDLVYPSPRGDTLRFKHGITREVVYHSIRLKRRQAQHLEIARILEQRASHGGDNLLESLAYHFSRASDHENAAKYAELAGDKANAASAMDRAREQYRAAVIHLEQLPPAPEVNDRLFAVSQRWVRVCVYSPARDQLDILQRIADRAREVNRSDAIAQAEYGMGFVKYSLGDQLEAVDHYVEALRVADEIGLEKLAVQITANLGQSYAAACDYESGLKYLDDAIEIKRRHPSQKALAQGSGYALACKGFVLADQGDFSSAMDAFETALSGVRARGSRTLIEGSILSLQGAVFIWQGRWGEALNASQRAQAIGARANGPYVFAMSEVLSGYVNWIQNGSVDALELLVQATGWLEEWDMLLFSSMPYGWLTDALMNAGRDDEAVRYAKKAIARVGVQDRLGEAMAYRSMARIAERSEPGEIGSPDRYLELAMNAAHVRGSRHDVAVTKLHQAEWFIQSDRVDEAQVILEETRRSFHDMGMLWHEKIASKFEKSLVA